MMRPLLFAAIVFSTAHARAQWTIQNSGTTADLRGIDNVGGGVAWASGTNGTVLRTEDAGYLWQHCTTPPGAVKLDFRGVQAFDANTAIVMSSGPGDLSRLYKTTDGCQTWKLVATNPYPEGFWDALIMDQTGHNGWLFGDPVQGTFFVTETHEDGARWPDLPKIYPSRLLSGAVPVDSQKRAAFAASNSAFATPPLQGWIHPKIATDSSCRWTEAWFGTSGPEGAEIYRLQQNAPHCTDWGTSSWEVARVPVDGASESSGVFSIAAKNNLVVVSVGGDYRRPSNASAVSASSLDGGITWHAATTQPHGFRSAVAYDAAHKTWITVGPNGTDISTDDGRNWHPLQPVAGDEPDADKNWNALSLPFVAGPHGRIGMLHDDALKARPQR